MPNFNIVPEVALMEVETAVDTAQNDLATRSGLQGAIAAVHGRDFPVAVSSVDFRD